MSTLHICYVTHARVPTEKAYGLQKINTVYHLALVGASVHFIGTHNSNPITQNLFSYYGIPQDSFVYEEVWSSKLFRNTRIGFWISMLSFSCAVLPRTMRKEVDVIYSREPFPLLFLAMLGKKTLYEMHDFPSKHLWFHKLLCRTVSHVAVTNAWAQEHCVSDFGLDPQKILLVPNGYDEEKFNGRISKEVVRAEFSLSQEKKIVLYSGHLYAWKGVQILLEVACLMPDVLFLFVGGSISDRDALLKGHIISNALFVPHQRPDMVPRYLATADILVLPNVPLNNHSEFSTSPIKLFEYLASRRPVVASRLPSITSLVSENEVVFAEAGNAVSWSQALSAVLSAPEQYATMVERAALHVQQYTWKRRAEKILKHLTA